MRRMDAADVSGTEWARGGSVLLVEYGPAVDA